MAWECARNREDKSIIEISNEKPEGKCEIG